MKVKRVLLTILNNWPYVSAYFAQSLIDMLLYSKQVIKETYVEVYFEFIWGAYIDQMRNDAAAKCIAGQFDYLVMLDADQYYPRDTVHRLIAHDKPVINGVYYWKILKPTKTGVLAYAPHVYKKRPKEMFSKRNLVRYDPIDVRNIEEDIIEVDGLGGGGICIKREVLEKIGRPQFECTWYDEDLTGEDLDFCRKAKTAGFKIYCDLTLQFGHVKEGMIYGGKLHEINQGIWLFKAQLPDEKPKKSGSKLPIKAMLKKLNGGRKNAKIGNN